MKLKRVPTGYSTLDGRYLIERQDGMTECTHPSCDILHHRWIALDMHLVPYVAWHVWDTVIDDYAFHEEFDTKREAVGWLERHLAVRSAP